MKIYEYSFNNSSLPSSLHEINKNYSSILYDTKPSYKFLYHTILDFKKSLIYTLNNKEGDIVSYAYLFRVLEDKTKEFDLPSKTYIIREVETIKQYRRRGYCKKLMNWIYNNHKNKFIFLEVNESNIYALKFFSFLKPYKNNLLDKYYFDYHNENKNWFNTLSSFIQKQMLNNYPHVLSKLLLYSN